MAEENKEVQVVTPVSSGNTDFDLLKDRANDTFQKYRTLIFGTLAAIILVGGGYYVYTAWFKAPKEAAAKEAIFMAQRYFEIDSFQLALDGRGEPETPGAFMGFLDIIENYSGTSGANLSHYYAGTALLYLGKYDEAITYLSNYSGGDDNTQAMAYGLLGDAHSEKGDMETAIAQYAKAANYAKNESVSPYFLRKAGLLCEHTQKAEDAKKYYEQIEKEYPLMGDKMGIKKDIIRVTGAY